MSTTQIVICVLFSVLMCAYIGVKIRDIVVTAKENKRKSLEQSQSKQLPDNPEIGNESNGGEQK